jgi:TPR repeat protein
MAHATRIIASVAVLAALGVGVPVQAQTPEIDALRAGAEAGVASAQFTLGFMYAMAKASRQCEGRDVKSVISRMPP